MRPDLVALVAAAWAAVATVMLAVCVTAKRADAEDLEAQVIRQHRELHGPVALIPASTHARQMQEQGARRFVQHTHAA
jgi:hypothetical protein